MHMHTYTEALTLSFEKSTSRNLISVIAYHYNDNQVSCSQDSLEIILLEKANCNQGTWVHANALTVSLDELSETEWKLSLFKRLPWICIYQILKLQAAFEVNYVHILFMIEWTFYKMHAELTA